MCELVNQEKQKENNPTESKRIQAVYVHNK